MICRTFGFAAVIALVFWGLCREGISAPQSVYVCRDAGAGGFEAFPDVCRLDDGRLMVAFYAGYQHASTPNAQYPKGGRICCCTSSDDGYSWSQAQVLYDGPNDDRDPSIVQLKSGQMICDFFSASEGTSIVASNNLGKTWSEPRTLYAAAYYTSSPIRELANGRLILPLYWQKADTAFGALGISDDQGKTWSKAVNIPNGGHWIDAETDVIQLKDGSLYAVQRVDFNLGPMYFSVSKDRGNTWSVSESIGFTGHCPYLYRTSDGTVLLSYWGGPNSIRYSRDEFKTWSDPVVGGNGYTSMVNLKDGSVLIVGHVESGTASDIVAQRFRVTANGIEWLPVAPLPEPRTLSLLITGGAGLPIFARPRRKRRVFPQ